MTAGKPNSQSLTDPERTLSSAPQAPTADAAGNEFLTARFAEILAFFRPAEDLQKIRAAPRSPAPEESGAIVAGASDGPERTREALREEGQ